MRHARITQSEEMRNPAYKFGVVPKQHTECSKCGIWPTLTGHKNFPSLWLFTSTEALLKFKETGECQPCQNGEYDV